ncbi:MAG: insulinase family protein [Bryobacteraceae bacterium]
MTIWSAKAIRAAGLLALLPSLPLASAPGNFAELPQRAQEFQLANGMRVVVVERHAAPVVAFHMRAAAGSADEPEGKSGICLLAERMFYHGSDAIGSRSPAQEKAVLQAVERHMDAVSAEQGRGEKANPLLSQDSEIQARIAIGSANAMGHRGVFREALESSGAVNAAINPGGLQTDFHALLPAHRAEVWPRMIGEWLRKPSARFFYEERGALSARLGEQQRPNARVRAELIQAAFPASPYARIQAKAEEAIRLRPRDLEAFVASRWSPANLVLAIVGDITLAEAKRMAETHFGKLAAAPAQPRVVPKPLELAADKRITVEMQAAPTLALAWNRPGGKHQDDPAFDVLAALLEARKGPVFSQLEELLAAVRVSTALPSDRGPCLFTVEAVLPPTQTFASVEKQLGELFAQLAAEPLPAAAVDAAKRALRSRVTGALEANTDMASLLARSVSDRGSVKALEDALDRVAAITPADIQRLASQYLVKPKFVVHAGLPGMVEETE